MSPCDLGHLRKLEPLLQTNHIQRDLVRNLLQPRLSHPAGYRQRSMCPHKGGGSYPLHCGTLPRSKHECLPRHHWTTFDSQQTRSLELLTLQRSEYRCLDIHVSAEQLRVSPLLSWPFSISSKSGLRRDVSREIDFRLFLNFDREGSRTLGRLFPPRGQVTLQRGFVTCHGFIIHNHGDELLELVNPLSVRLRRFRGRWPCPTNSENHFQEGAMWLVAES